MPTHCTPGTHVYTDCTPATCPVARAEEMRTTPRSSIGYDAEPAPRATLSRAMSAVRRVVGSHEVAAELDALFDGGEFSGAFHSHEVVARDCERALTRLGWTLQQAMDEAQRRTSPRWLYSSGLLVSRDEPECAAS